MGQPPQRMRSRASLRKPGSSEQWYPLRLECLRIKRTKTSGLIYTSRQNPNHATKNRDSSPSFRWDRWWVEESPSFVVGMAKTAHRSTDGRLYDVRSIIKSVHATTE